MYNGQLDVIVGAPLTERFLQVLEWSGKSKYLKAEKKVWKIGTDVAGYVRAVDNFYQVSIERKLRLIFSSSPCSFYPCT